MVRSRNLSQLNVLTLSGDDSVLRRVGRSSHLVRSSELDHPFLVGLSREDVVGDLSGDGENLLGLISDLERRNILGTVFLSLLLSTGLLNELRTPDSRLSVEPYLGGARYFFKVRKVNKIIHFPIKAIFTGALRKNQKNWSTGNGVMASQRCCSLSPIEIDTN